MGESLPSSSSLYLIPPKLIHQNSISSIPSHIPWDGGEPHSRGASVPPSAFGREKPELDDAGRDARGERASERASNQPPTLMLADVEEKEEAAEKGGGGSDGGGGGGGRAPSSGPACVNVP